MRILFHTFVLLLFAFMLRGLPSLYAVALRKVVGVRKSNYFSSLSATESGLSSNRERNQLRLINLKLSEKRNIRAAKPAREKAPRTAIGDTQVTAGPSSSHFPALGLCGDLVAALDAQGIQQPTPVQKAVIPRILSGENLLMAASTGSGKTLAYMLPCMQELRIEEEQGYARRPKRPRCIVLVPTRELARQVLHSVKQIGHYSKVASTAVLGGEQYGEQTKQLDRMVDVVVASPGRLMQHKQQGNVYFSHVRHVIIDEVDTMLMEGFGSDIRAILRSVMARHSKESSSPPPTLTLSNALPLTQLAAPTGSGAGTGVEQAAESSSSSKRAQVIMATATLTKAVKSLLTDVQGGFNIEYSDPSNQTPRATQQTDQLLKINIVEVDGVHRSLPNVTHVFEDAQKEDKLGVLRDVLARHRNKQLRTLIFCNTVASCRAVEYAINQDTVVGGSFSGGGTGTGNSAEHAIRATSYHGDLNSNEREQNLARFRNGTEQYMVCSDIAARGLDIPEIGHIVMFDFPLNPIDYLHRAGRCGRAGRKGLVTSLVAKRDVVLAGAIEEAIGKGLPIDALTSDKKDYTGKGKMVKMLKVPRNEDQQEQNFSRHPRSRSFSADRRGSERRAESNTIRSRGDRPAASVFGRSRSNSASSSSQGGGKSWGGGGSTDRRDSSRSTERRNPSSSARGFRGSSRKASPFSVRKEGSHSSRTSSPSRSRTSDSRSSRSSSVGGVSGESRRRDSSPPAGDQRSSSRGSSGSSGGGARDSREQGSRGGGSGGGKSRSASFRRK